MPLSKKDIAEAVGWAPSQLSRGRFKTMPSFETVDGFKQWEVTTRKRGTSKFINDVSALVSSTQKNPESEVRDTSCGEVLIDWKKFHTEPENHLAVTLNRGMSISNMAYALLEAAVERGDIAATFGAIKNWSAALKEESEVRSKLLQQQMDERSVIALDEVKHVVGLIIQEIVTEIESMLNRGAVEANPDNPQKALNAYQVEFDRLKMRVQGVLSRVESELSSEYQEEVEQCAG